MHSFEVEHYIDERGRDLFLEWESGLRDRVARIAIDQRLTRVEEGNFGDHKYLRDGVSELRIKVGPGYRLYYGIKGKRVVLLLCGGDKGTQSSDIERACHYWQNVKEREGDHE